MVVSPSGRRLLGWQPQYSFEQMIELMVDNDLKVISNE
jgi:GDP-D-mannose dehydratase